MFINDITQIHKVPSAFGCFGCAQHPKAGRNTQHLTTSFYQGYLCYSCRVLCDVTKILELKRINSDLFLGSQLVPIFLNFTFVDCCKKNLKYAFTFTLPSICLHLDFYHFIFNSFLLQRLANLEYLCHGEVP